MTKKELRSQILKSRSTDHWHNIISIVSQSSELFSFLINLAYDSDKVLSFRASWILDNCTELHPELLDSSKVEKIAINTIEHTNQSVTRASLRMLSRERLPESTLGILTDKCFKWLGSNSSPIAVKVYAMQILYNITLREPGLKNELQIIIEDQLPNGSAGFKSRGKRILKQLGKLK